MTARDGAKTRAERSAAALRDNLRKRKEQARARTQDRPMTADPPPAEAAANPGKRPDTGVSEEA